MHEMSLCQNIVAIVAEHAHDQKVARVRLEIGAFSSVMPEALEFCFDVVAKGTVLEGAVLEIIEIKGRARCQACGKEMDLTSQFDICSCGSSDIERFHGDELKIKEMELAAV